MKNLLTESEKDLIRSLYLKEEIKIGDIRIDKGKKYTVTDIDSETGGISWKIENLPDFFSVFQSLRQSDQLMFELLKNGDLSGVSNLRKVRDDVHKSLNSFRTFLRNEYPKEYEKIKDFYVYHRR